MRCFCLFVLSNRYCLWQWETLIVHVWLHLVQSSSFSTHLTAVCSQVLRCFQSNFSIVTDRRISSEKRDSPTRINGIIYKQSLYLRYFLINFLSSDVLVGLMGKGGVHPICELFLSLTSFFKIQKIIFANIIKISQKSLI